MMWLIFSVVSSSALMVIFKLFGRFKVEIFPAIVFNYLTCFVLGNLFLGQDNLFSNPVWNQPWLPRIAVLGFFFISAFYLMGLSTPQCGCGRHFGSGQNECGVARGLQHYFFERARLLVAVDGHGLVAGLCVPDETHQQSIRR